MTKGIMELDHFELQYFLYSHGTDLIAWTDSEAIERYKEFAWVYDKHILGTVTGTPTELVTPELIEKSKSDLFIKPRINLAGMGRRARAYSPGDTVILPTEPMVAQPVLVGRHLTTDYVVGEGEVLGFFTFEALKDPRGSFLLFESKGVVDAKATDLARKLSNSGYKGIVNVESIGGKVIEAHLRPSNQFADICGGLIHNALRYMRREGWRGVKPEKTYSRVYRRPMTGTPYIEETPDRPWKGVSSVQFTWYPDQDMKELTQDEFSFRYLVINGTDLASIEAYGDYLNAQIKFR